MTPRTHLGFTERTPLVRVSVVDSLSEALRSQILSGDLMPGQPITQAAICNAYGVSRPTAIDALRNLRLNHGLLQQQSHHSYMVRQFSQDNLADILTAQRVVEIDCFIENVSDEPALVSTLSKSCPGLEASIYSMSSSQNSSLAEVLQQDFDFHSLLMRVADNPWLHRLHMRNVDEFHLAAFQREEPYDSVVLARQHEGILEAIDEGFAPAEWNNYREAAWEHLQTLGGIALGQQAPIPSF